ncbi:hypothetical protein CL657_05910 [bacterium]|nr:hypothetical protein [bacterium]|tara:strand:- start:367 stop:693 length:327 start_codon:yes stop_codon:yes gene_type:complete
MNLLPLTTAQVCCLLSLTLVIIELICFYWIKRIILTHSFDAILFDQLDQFFNNLKPEHIIAYCTLYAIVLFLAKYWIYLFIFIFAIQIISLGCNSFIIHRILKKKKKH